MIEVMPGLYKGQVGIITQSQLTIRGVGERPVFEADGRQAEGKAIWVVRDGDVTIENIEFRGARVPDANGAGIRFEKGRLLLRRCRFVDNQIGLLTANFNDAELMHRGQRVLAGAAPGRQPAAPALRRPHRARSRSPAAASTRASRAT